MSDWQPGDPIHPRRHLTRDMIQLCRDDDSGAQWFWDSSRRRDSDPLLDGRYTDTPRNDTESHYRSNTANVDLSDTRMPKASHQPAITR